MFHSFFYVSQAGSPPFPAPEPAFPGLRGLTLGVEAVAARQLRRRRQLIGTGAVEDPGVDLGAAVAGWEWEKAVGKKKQMGNSIELELELIYLMMF